MAGIVLGGFIGLFFGRYLSETMQKSLVAVTGVCVLLIGILGLASEMLIVTDGKLTCANPLMLILCLVLGTAVGEWFDLEAWIERFGVWLKARSGSEKDPGFLNAFVSSSLVVCIGAMAVVGAVEDGLSGNIAMLEAKAVLDAIIIMVMAASLGRGCLFSAIPVGLLQGSMTVLAVWLKPFMTEAVLSAISAVGSAMIFCVGLNLVFALKIRVANTLPALVLAVLWASLHISF
ncbi:MAG: DUF554 domain-containing protein [Sutterella sp.]|jgi:hypothetical protein|nr:DUF554 domain-containing protein [Sutterella sp.]